jgi:hypothetical protein
MTRAWMCTCAGFAGHPHVAAAEIEMLFNGNQAADESQENQPGNTQKPPKKKMPWSIKVLPSLHNPHFFGPPDNQCPPWETGRPSDRQTEKLLSLTFILPQYLLLLGCC